MYTLWWENCVGLNKRFDRMVVCTCNHQMKDLPKILTHIMYAWQYNVTLGIVAIACPRLLADSADRMTNNTLNLVS